MDLRGENVFEFTSTKHKLYATNFQLRSHIRVIPVVTIHTHIISARTAALGVYESNRRRERSRSYAQNDTLSHCRAVCGWAVYDRVVLYVVYAVCVCVCVYIRAAQLRCWEPV